MRRWLGAFAAAFERRGGRRPSALAVLLSEPRGVPPRSAMLLIAAVRRFWPVATRPLARRRSLPHVSVRAWSRETGWATGACAHARRRGARIPRWLLSWLWSRPAASATSRRRGAPSKARSQSPASSISRRAFPRARGGSLRERTRRPGSSAPCRHACPCERVPLLPSQAYESLQGWDDATTVPRSRRVPLVWQRHAAGLSLNGLFLRLIGRRPAPHLFMFTALGLWLTRLLRLIAPRCFLLVTVLLRHAHSPVASASGCKNRVNAALFLDSRESWLSGFAYRL